LNLHTTISLTLSESLLGFDRLVLVHLDKRGLRVHQPAPGEKGWRVLKAGDLVVIKGEGLWRKGERGDLICKVEVEMPGADWAAGLSADKVCTLLGSTCTLPDAHGLLYIHRSSSSPDSCPPNEQTSRTTARRTRLNSRSLLRRFVFSQDLGYSAHIDSACFLAENERRREAWARRGAAADRRRRR
jgi:DnaJ-class molecular chaperone